MSDSEQEEQAPQAKVRAPNRHRFKNIAQRIDEVRGSSASCCRVAGSLLAAAVLLLLPGHWQQQHMPPAAPAYNMFGAELTAKVAM